MAEVVVDINDRNVGGPSTASQRGDRLRHRQSEAKKLLALVELQVVDHIDQQQRGFARASMSLLDVAVVGAGRRKFGDPVSLVFERALDAAENPQRHAQKKCRDDRGEELGRQPASSEADQEQPRDRQKDDVADRQPSREQPADALVHRERGQERHGSEDRPVRGGGQSPVLEEVHHSGAEILLTTRHVRRADPSTTNRSASCPDDGCNDCAGPRVGPAASSLH